MFMFFKKKLIKWIEAEILALRSDAKWHKNKGDSNQANVCYEKAESLDDVLYIIKRKGVWAKHRSHDILKVK